MTAILNNPSVLIFLLNKIPHGVVLCNLNYEIVLWNDFTSRLIGDSVKTVSDGLWQKEGKYFTRDGKPLMEEDRALYMAVKNNQETTSKTIVKYGDKEYYIETEAYPLHDEQNNIIGGAAFFKDVTANVKMDKTLNEIQEKLNEILEYLKPYII